MMAVKGVFKSCDTLVIRSVFYFLALNLFVHSLFETGLYLGDFLTEWLKYAQFLRDRAV